MTVKYFVNKFLFLVLSLFLVASLTFFLMHLAPGDPFLQEQAVPKEVMQSMYAHYGLDKPLHIQYLKYLKGLFTWDLGPSFKFEGRSVNSIIYEGFSVSALLGLEAILIALPLGIFIGVVAALKRSLWPDRLCMILTVLGISVPSFIKATLLQYFFAMKLDLFPVARWESFSHSILPAFALAALPTAFLARLTRNGMIEVFQQDYIITAKSKGLSTTQIILKHGLKNGLLPVMSYLGPVISGILTGSFIIEKIFGIPGLGGWLVNSVNNRDYTVIAGVTIFYSAILMVSVFIVDVCYTFLDPRITLKNTKAR